ncbi:MAG: beta-galactosidase [Ferruginibacter sp.]|nr:beta-galactosidase [Ferruginibacter sp.]
MNWRKILTTSLVVCATSYVSPAQKIYEMDVNVPEMRIYSDHLKLGGTNPKGEKISVNNYYISINNKSIIPVTGEFHFSRYPNQYWDESIKKMKAGGITVIPTYVFWNLHEEEEGKFLWSGDKNLRTFIELCRKNNMYAIVRIGPFCHGEIRNGGMPDWLLGKPLNIRINDPMYLSYVQRLYRQIATQLKGLYYQDGGPIIGIQIENEYQHSAAPWGLTYPGQPHDFTASERDRDVTHEGVAVSTEKNPYADLGNDHMKALKTIAVREGIIAPIYTATGWGNAAIIPNESIPVTAAYAYPFWTPKRDFSPFFLYKNMHAKPDYAPVRYKPEDYPAFPAELGSGISLVYTRRPVVVHQSFDAMINRCLGSGANGVGYYMFHGGSTPRGKNNYMNDEAYGVTKISYEYQGPIGEYGQVREGFHRLKLIHFFLKDFGDLLAPMQVVLPANAPGLTPENTRDLRYAARIKGNAGFLFLNNFQDDTTMLDQDNIRVKIKTGNGDVLVPETGGINLVSGENAILPFNFNLNGTKLNYATAQLLMKGDNANPYFVFFTPKGINGEFSFAPGTTVENVRGATIDPTAKRVLVKCKEKLSEFSIVAGGKKTNVLVIDKALALKSYIVSLNGKKSLFFSEAVVLQNENRFELLSEGINSFDVDIYPKTTIIPKASVGTVTAIRNANTFSSYRFTLPLFQFAATTKEISTRKMTVALPQTIPPGVNDIWLNVNYTGDTGMDFINGELVADNFYNGIPWQVGLRKFMASPAKPKEMVLYFRPMEKNATYLLDLQPYPQYIPDFGKSASYLKVNSISFTPQYKTTIKF